MCIPCRRGLEVGEVRVQDSDGVVTHHVDEVNVGEPGPQLANHLPPVLRQHGVQLALVVTQGDVPRQDVVPVGVVEHWGRREGEKTQSGNTSLHFNCNELKSKIIFGKF